LEFLQLKAIINRPYTAYALKKHSVTYMANRMMNATIFTYKTLTSTITNYSLKTCKERWIRKHLKNYLHAWDSSSNTTV